MADLKWLARLIFQETLAAIDIPAVMQRKVRVEGAKLRCDEIALDLSAFSRIRVVAIGKAAHAMLDGLRATLPADLSFDGIVSAPTSPAQALPGIEYFAGGHPIPNAESWNSAQAILSLLTECDESTLVFFLLSGGGSARQKLLLPSPTCPLSRNRRWRRALRYRTRALLRTLSVSLRNSRCFNNFLQRCAAAWKKERSGRRRKKRTRFSQTRILCCCWGWTIYFIPRISRRRRRVFLLVAIIRLTTGRWKKQPRTCSGSSACCKLPTPAAGWQSSRMEKSARL